MNFKALIVVIAGLFATGVYAESNLSKNLSASIEYTHSNIEFDVGSKTNTKGVLLGLITYGLWKLYKKLNLSNLEAQHRYNNSWVCLKCGTRFIP